MTIRALNLLVAISSVVLITKDFAKTLYSLQELFEKIFSKGF